MEIIDRPNLRCDAPIEFRLHVCRLMLVWFWASWDEGRDQQGEDCRAKCPDQQAKGYGFAGAHAVTGAAGSGIQ